MFKNREEAGHRLTKKLHQYQHNPQVVVVAIPRGGVVVGKVIANDLNIPLTVVVVKKLGAPDNPEMAIGALAPKGVKVINWDLALRIGVEQKYLDEEIKRKSKEVEERMRKFEIRNSKFEINNRIQVLNYKTIILTDDGVATGATVQAAIKFIKESVKGTALSVTLILAVPVIGKDTFDKLKSEADDIVTLEIAQSFTAVGQFYQEFPQVSDEEVEKML